MNSLLDGSVRRFGVVGALNTGVGLSIIFACKALAGMGDVAANFTGYAIAVAMSFVLHKRWTFGHRGHTGPALARYLVVLAAAYASNLAVAMFAIEILRLNSYFSQTLGIVPYAITCYAGSRWFAFADARPSHQARSA
jgi:putative flippase GtrA